MNIFVLDEKPTVAARYHLDVHVNKMILETAQLLSTAHRLLDDIPADQDILYKKTHFNHPCAKWVRENSANYYWAFDLFLSLCNEYTYRYGKIHKTDDILSNRLSFPPQAIPISDELTPFALAMPDQFRSEDAVESYQAYYQFKVETLSRISWKNRPIPFFIQLPSKEN